MPKEEITSELAAALRHVREAYDYVQFFNDSFLPEVAQFVLVDPDLLSLLKVQPEFSGLYPGSPPRLIYFSGDYNTDAGIVIYRSKADDYYLAAPV